MIAARAATAPRFEVRVGGTAARAARRRRRDRDRRPRGGRPARPADRPRAELGRRTPRPCGTATTDPSSPAAGSPCSLGYHSELTTVFEGVDRLADHALPARRAAGASRGGPVQVDPDGPPAAVAAAGRRLRRGPRRRGRRRLLAHHRRRRRRDPARTSSATGSATGSSSRRRAAELGWVTYVRGDTLVLRPPAPHAGRRSSSTTRASLVELHLTQDLTHAIDSAVGVGWDARRAGGGASPSRARAPPGVDLADRAAHDAAVRRRRAGRCAPSGSSRAAVTGRRRTPTRARSAAQRRAALAHYSGSGVVHGEPEAALRPLGHDHRGRATGMSGPHYVSAARHRLSRTATDRVPARRSPPAAPAAEPAPADRPALARWAWWRRSTTPSPLNRVKVRLPWREDDGDGVWARLATLDAGRRVRRRLRAERRPGGAGRLRRRRPAPPGGARLALQRRAAPPVIVDPDNERDPGDRHPRRARARLDDGDAARSTLETGKGNSVMLNDDGLGDRAHPRDSGNAIRLSADGIELDARPRATSCSSRRLGRGQARLAEAIEGKAIGPVQARELRDVRPQGVRPAGPQGCAGQDQLEGGGRCRRPRGWATPLCTAARRRARCARPC